MKKWRCTVCGYIHVGEAPPAECPVCGAGPEFFAEISADLNLKNGENTITSSSRPEIQNVLLKLPCGLFIVCSRKGAQNNGMINNIVFQITDQPLQILLGMDKRREYCA